MAECLLQTLRCEYYYGSGDDSNIDLSETVVHEGDRHIVLRIELDHVAIKQPLLEHFQKVTDFDEGIEDGARATLLEAFDDGFEEVTELE